MSGIGHLLFLGWCWTYCNVFQVVAFSADLFIDKKHHVRYGWYIAIFKLWLQKQYFCSVANARSALCWMGDSPPTVCARRIAQIYKCHEQAGVIAACGTPIVACCHTLRTSRLGILIATTGKKRDRPGSLFNQMRQIKIKDWVTKSCCR